MKFTLNCIVLSALFLLQVPVVGFLPCYGDENPAQAVSDESQAEIEELIGLLGSPDFDVREKAQKALMEIGAAAEPFLKTALKSPDPEVRNRVQIALSAIRTGNIAGGFIADNSGLFGDESDNCWITAGDADNDGTVDVVVSKHKDFGTGQMAVFRRKNGKWDNGTVVIAGIHNGVQRPSIGNTGKKNADKILYWVHYQSNSGGSLNMAELSVDGPAMTYQFNSMAWPGATKGIMADLDNDGESEVYALDRETTSKLNKYAYDPQASAYKKTMITDTGLEESDYERLLYGKFNATGLKSIIYHHGYHKLHNLTYANGKYASDEIASSEFQITGLSSGYLDKQPEEDVVFAVNDGHVSQIYMVSGGLFVKKLLAQEDEYIVTTACADLDGDGTDEVYAAGNNGSIFRYEPSTGWNLVERNPTVSWKDSERARWTGEKRDSVVFAGIEGTNITVQELKKR